MRDARVRQHPLDARSARRPTTVPTIIVAAAITQSAGAHSARSGSSAERNTRANAANAAAFTPVDMKPVTGARRAFVRVRRPHVERDGRHLEREADEQQPHRHELQRRGCQRLGRDQRADPIEARAAGDAVGEGDAVEKERAGKRAEQEILERGFGGGRRIAANAGEDVDAKRQHLEREEDDEQIGGHRHQHHAGERKQHQRVVLAARQPLALDDRRRYRQRQHADDDQHAGDEERRNCRRRRRRSWPRRGSRAAPTTIAAPASPMIAERPDRHALAGRAERLGGHRRDRRRGDAGHRHDRAERCEAERLHPERRFSHQRPSARTSTGPRRACVSIRSTDGAIGRRKRFGSTPISTITAMIGTTSAHSRGFRSGSAAFFSVDRAVVDALEHPQHVGRRQDDAGRGKGRHLGLPRERAEQDQELADEPVQAGQADRRQRDDAGTPPPGAASTFFSPPNSAISRVCRRSDSMPTMRKSPPVLTPWFSIW